MIKILFICDYSVIHSRRWINNLMEQQLYDIYVISTGYYNNSFGDHFYNLKEYKPIKNIKIWKYKLFCKLPYWQSFQSFLQDISYLTIYFNFKKKVLAIANKINPDIIHALRIQPEGYLGKYANKNSKLFLSTWGQDLILYKNNLVFNFLNKKTLKYVNTLFVDTLRDKYIADLYGMKNSSTIKVFPATGGLDLNEFEIVSFDERSKLKKKFLLDRHFDENTITFLSCRGFGRRYIDFDIMLKTFHHLMEKGYDIHLIIDGNVNSPGFYYLSKMIKELKIENICTLISLNHGELIKYMKAIDYYISFSKSDGLPISMLESMICGMIPIMSNLRIFESWVIDNVNGYLVDLSDIKLVIEKLESIIIYYSKQNNKYREIIETNYSLIRNNADRNKFKKEIAESYLI
jgi:glycosyltransferase involved in cell wall biosynthesis